ncbi:Major facilitator superfamily domain, general substrate transporter [Niveomyces insectorum RCEF 264]|uniref:Major facilitator superfamily domain, general substrate transporter n=1 Tax=Niveomyces insectorum RCEF 264 TaxID=1081102 RepID=A0A167SFC5_9HYPO|nr:Major facilitator superfamily domain, general substrate transporter [Niveomyces insectorum RCEF 264]
MNHEEEARATEHEPRRQAQPSRSGDWLEYQEGEAFQLSPVDRGRDAWTVLIAGIVFEALFWGFPMCFGVFQNYYADMHELTGNAADIPLIGTLAQGLYYLGAPFSAFLATKYPKYQRRQIWAGWPLCIAGLVAASFTTSVHGLIGTQGLLYGFGFVTLSYPIVSMLNEWWVARKGMAFGLISASSGITGAFMPSIVELLLRTYGYRTTLRACAVALAVLTGPLVPLFRSRLPASEHARLRRINWGFLHRPLFWVYGAATLVQGLGFYLPVVFLPSYATSLDISSARGALLLALMSVAQVLGQFTFGYLSDKKVSVGLLSCVCCVAAGTASLSLWGRGTSLGLLAVFSLVYGFFGFGFGTMRVAMARAIDNDPSAVFALFAIFVSLQGIGNILVGPMSMALLAGPVLRGRFGVKHYAGLIILTGVSSLFAALVIAGWHGYKRKVILRSN